MSENYLKDVKRFIEEFEKKLETEWEQKDRADFLRIRESELDEGFAAKGGGDCAAQTGCGSKRCKDRIDPCLVRYCHRLHNCASNCQVADDCKVNVCSGRQV